MKSKGGSNFVYLIIIAAVLFLVYSYIAGGNTSATVPLNQIARDAAEGKIASISVRGDELQVTYKFKTEAGDQLVLSRKGQESSLVEQLQALGVGQAELQQVDIEFVEPVDWGTMINIGITLLSILAGVAFFYFFIRQFQGANNQALSFGKSKARLFSGDRPTIGAPGTGKTLLAKAVAGEAGVPFFSISGSEFVEMFVGVGASRVRDLFDQAKKHSPCIIFVDEIDAVGRHRGAGLGGSHDEREQTLNQILVEMDGFDTDTNVIVVAATNRPDILDPALLRPGRFDRRVVLDQPDIRGREAIFRVHVRGKPVAAEVDLGKLAQSTPGFVGADIENAINEAAILAARRGKRRITMSEFEAAIERVLAGPERHSRVISEEERKIFAYHEAGHAVVASILPKCDPVRKVSIVARGMAGGYTLTIPDQDHYIMQRGKMLDEMVKILGGRAAEEVVFDEISTGASNDLEKVTKLARAMVTRYGMSDKLGPLVYGRKEELVFLGKEIGEQRDYSDAKAEAIDDEVREFVITSYERAKDIMREHREQLDRVAKHLLERETLSSEELLAAMDGRPLPAKKDEEEVEEAAEVEAVLNPSPAAV